MTAYIIIAQNGNAILESLKPMRRDAIEYITGFGKQADWQAWKATGYDVKKVKITIMQ